MNSIRIFLISIIIASIVLLGSIFYYYFNSQLNNSAQIIVKSIRKDMSALTYTLSHQLEDKEELSKYKALLDRIQASNDFIDSITVADTNHILLSSNYKFKDLPKASEYYVPDMMSSMKILQEKKILSDEIVFFDNNKRVVLSAFVKLDTNYVDSHLNHNTQAFVLNIVMASIIYFVFIIFLIVKFIIMPLEKLRQYAYYQSEIPKKIYLKDLEYIRSSMFQTFTRLEEERKELYKISRTDSLSGLANREYLHERLIWLIAESKRENKEFALLFLDLDRFKAVNDSLGHNVGDILLKDIARVIEKSIRTNDIVARVGGDEFVIVLTQYDSLIELTHVIDRIQQQIAMPHIVQTHTLEVSSSIGISFYPKDAQDEVNLMKNADIAMYQAKKNGRSQYNFFTQELNNEIQQDIQLTNEMKQALKNGEFELYYQPKNSVNSGNIVGCEALIRWNHPTKGIISPYIFIPLAEDDGFIVELGSWIMQEAINQQVKWVKEGICNIKMSINVSVKQLLHKNFEEEFLKIVEQSGIQTDKLDIEIVESLFLNNSTSILHTLNIFHRIGSTISLDDFGTGYSSLSYLKEFKVDTLKIDKIFIDDFDKEADAIFLETIIIMGQTLKLEVLCEGVETQEQLDFIKALGCDTYQGYLFSKPVPSKEFEKLLG